MKMLQLKIINLMLHTGLMMVSQIGMRPKQLRLSLHQRHYLAKLANMVETINRTVHRVLLFANIETKLQMQISR